MDNKFVNQKIRDHKLFVIDESGNKLGVLTKEEALNEAASRDLDLILVTPAEKTSNKIAIAKILDYGKFKYNQKIKERESKKKQTVIRIKEIKVRPQIGDHDLEWRANNAKEWLKEGYQIKFKIQAFGRIRFKPELIDETYQKFVNLISTEGKVLNPLKQLTPVLFESTIVKK